MQRLAAEELSRELVREVRGKRTQTALSRTLAYRSNIVHRWESGECYPTASVFLGVCARLRPQRRQLFERFFKRAPGWLDPRDPFSPAQIAVFLQQLRGKTPLKTLAAQSGYSRFQITRWLRGQTQPKLPELLSLIEAASRRSLDFIAELCDPENLPSVAAQWRQLTRAREAAYTAPWSHAVLHALELQGYRAARGKAALQFLSKSLGISSDEVNRSLALLLGIGHVRKVGTHYEPDPIRSIDTSHDATRARGLKAWWTERALQRLRTDAPGSFGYSVFAVSRADLLRLRELQLEYVRAMQAIVAASRPDECVALYCSQLLDLSGSS